MYTLTVSAPNKYPAIEENTTLKESRILVISLKSEITEVFEVEEFETSAIGCIYAKVLRLQRYFKITFEQRKTQVIQF